MSSMTPFQSPHFAEHKAELARQRRIDSENAEQLRMRGEKQLQLQRGELRRREAELNERENQLRADRDAFDRQRDTLNLERAESMLIGNDARQPPVASKQQMAMAEQIIHLGKVRRAEIPDDSVLPPKGSLAWKILEAGRKRRGEA